ncbi:hypothetical protein [Agaribacterium sp. ZY112]|uniref:hypothetical protein n=1 Tax=Agaribacterium sp. ZY112 TaxID=3233574 RepID=UPI00352352A4
MSTAIAIATVMLICTEICYFVAKKKGLNRPLWVILGALLGPISVIAVFLVKSNKS